MKAIDRLGNELRPGDMAYFAPLQTVVVVMDVEEPGKIADTPGSLSLGIKVPFKFDKGQTTALFADLMKVHHPGEGAAVEDQVNDILKNSAPKRPLQISKGR